MILLTLFASAHITAAPQDNWRIIQAVNGLRIERHIPALKYDPALTKIAHAKAIDMCKRHYWGHKPPTGEWTDFFKGYNKPWFGENLAYGFDTPDDVANGWRNSPGHYSNIIRKEFNRTGMATVVCPNYQGGHNVNITVNSFGGQR